MLVFDQVLSIFWVRLIDICYKISMTNFLGSKVQ